MYELTYEQADIDRWFDGEGEGSIVVRSNLGTYPIFDFIELKKEAESGGTWGNLWGDLWFHPETGKILAGRCPFLRKVRKKDMYRCIIYELRPEICRGYPGPERRCLKKLEGIAGKHVEDVEA